MDNRIITHIVAVALGAFILYWFFWPEFETKTEVVEVRTSDTVYVTERDTIYRNKPVTRYLRDTVYVTETDTIALPIRSFSETFPNKYGSITAFGETAGELLQLSLSTDLTIPTVTNTVTKTETITITEKPRGLYVGASINSELIPSVGASYLDKSWIFNYDYQPSGKVHSIGVAKKLF